VLGNGEDSGIEMGKMEPSAQVADIQQRVDQARHAYRNLQQRQENFIYYSYN
jgi:hypothetical protein